MKRLYFLGLLTFMSIASCFAVDEQTHLVVWAKDGSKASYSLQDRPLIEFVENQILIKSNNLDIYYDLQSISHFTYEDIMGTGVKNLLIEEQFKMTEDALLFSGIPVNSNLTISDINGKNVYNIKVENTGKFAIPIKNFSKGLYIIKINNYSYKFIKK